MDQGTDGDSDIFQCPSAVLEHRSPASLPAGEEGIPLTNRPNAETAQTSKQSTRICRILLVALAVVVIVVIISLLVVVAILVVKITRNENTDIVATSCHQLRSSEDADGLFTIQLKQDSSQSQVFCDMTTDGGGWTLVASIHEKDIKRKCGTDDLWSTYLPFNKSNYTEKTNWENDVVFGSVIKATTSDYKNSAFFSLNATDVMVWHVPNGLTIANSSWKNQSSLRYRTTTGFLSSHGGNLGGVFTKYPLTVNARIEKTFLSRTKRVLDTLASRANNMTTAITGFYSYTYSESYPYSIPNTAMYRGSSYGNQVTYTSDSCTFRINYEREYRCANTIFDSRNTTPFLSAAAILNERRTKTFFQIQVQSYRLETRYVQSTMANSITKEDYKMQYRVLQFRYSKAVTLAEFYFLVTNSKDWGSVEPTSFYRSMSYTSDYTFRNAYNITGNPSNVVMGYTLLTRTLGLAVTEDEANVVAHEILDAISSLDGLFRETSEYTLSEPVTFDSGNPNDILQLVPSDLRPKVQPGFLQFRVYNVIGYPSAFCPGVKAYSTEPEYICIGGVSNNIGDYGTCGDYAGWEGISSEENRESRLSHAQKDIFSTILLFLR